MAVLRVTNLTKTFVSGWWPLQAVQEYTAVRNVSFDVQRQEIVGLLGANGAGKTTTLHMLLGILQPTSGEISYYGKDFATNRTYVLQNMGYASGYDRLPPRLTVTENLDVVGRLYGLSASQRAAQIADLLATFGMWDKRNVATGTLSAGQITRVMLAKAFLADPQIVLLDEPTASLDPDVAHEVRAFIAAQRAQRGTSFIITSHNMDEVTELCDRVIVLKRGEVVANDTPLNLARHTTRVRLTMIISHHSNAAEQVFADYGIFTLADGAHYTIAVEEHDVAQLLMRLSEQKVAYSHISIASPTLEDYFLTVARQ